VAVRYYIKKWSHCVTFVFNKLRDKTYLRSSFDSPSYILRVYHNWNPIQDPPMYWLGAVACRVINGGIKIMCFRQVGEMVSCSYPYKPGTLILNIFKLELERYQKSVGTL